MEAIRNYLETMFLNLPNTPEVYKAKNELWQMMEDKYTELKNEENRKMKRLAPSSRNLEISTNLQKILGSNSLFTSRDRSRLPMLYRSLWKMSDSFCGNIPVIPTLWH